MQAKRSHDLSRLLYKPGSTATAYGNRKGRITEDDRAGPRFHHLAATAQRQRERFEQANKRTSIIPIDRDGFPDYERPMQPEVSSAVGRAELPVRKMALHNFETCGNPFHAIEHNVWIIGYRYFGTKFEHNLRFDPWLSHLRERNLRLTIFDKM